MANFSSASCERPIGQALEKPERIERHRTEAKVDAMRT
jgi:hypothetical protein